MHMRRIVVLFTVGVLVAASAPGWSRAAGNDVRSRSTGDDLWSKLVEKAIAYVKLDRTSYEAQRYLELAVREAEKFKQPDLRLAGTLHMLAIQHANLLPYAAFRAREGQQPTPPWGRVPPPPTPLEAGKDKGATTASQEADNPRDDQVLLRRALDICLRLPDVNRRFVANCQYDLAWLEVRDANYEDAESHFNKAISIYATTGGTKVDLAKSLFWLGCVQDAQSKTSESDASFARAIEEYEHEVIPNHYRNLTHMLRRRALFALWQQRFDDAESLLNRAIVTGFRARGPNINEILAEQYYYLGCLQLMKENYSQALSHFQRALDAYEQPAEPEDEQSSEVVAQAERNIQSSGKSEPVPSVAMPAYSSKLRSSTPTIIITPRAPWKKTAQPYKPDDTVMAIPADEPVPLDNFPPLPGQLQLPVSLESWDRSQPKPGESGKDDRAAHQGDEFSPARRPLPMLQIPFFSVIAPFGGDSLSSSSTMSTDSFSAGDIPPPIDTTNIVLSASERLSADEILAALFARSDSDRFIPMDSRSGCAYWPDRNRAMRMIAMLLNKIKGREAGVSMDAMANAVSDCTEYLPEDSATRLRMEAADQYLNALRERVDHAWLPPARNVAEQASVNLTINDKGQLTGATVTRSSGDPDLDQSALRAISRAAPFAVAPPGMSTAEPITLVFDYHVLSLPGEALSSLHGVFLNAPDPLALDRQLYVAKLQEKVQRYWKMPSHRHGKTTQAHVRLAAAGQISHLCIARSSGDVDWDRSVIEAMTEAGPFWPIPEKTERNIDTWLDFTEDLSASRSARGAVKLASPAPESHEPNVPLYMKHVQERIGLSFFPPADLPDKPSITKFTIERDGSVSRLTLAQSCGSEKADQECLKAIERASPFYSPPVDAPETIDIAFSFACGSGSSWQYAPKSGAAASSAKELPAKIVAATLDLNSPPVSNLPTARVTTPQDFQPEPDVDFGPFMADLQRRIKRAWYPPHAGESKQVVVTFKVCTNGTVSDLRLEHSCGWASADNAALRAVESAGPFHALPDGAPPDVDIQFTFDYNIFGGGRGSFRAF